MSIQQKWKIEARKLLDQHGLHNWSLVYDRAKRRAGSCQYRRRIITLSIYYVQSNTDENIRNTLLHETAHALCPGCGHNQQWKEMCKLIGARPERCYGQDVKMPEGKWQASCNNCTKTYKRHRRSPSSSYYCPQCGPEKGRLLFRKAS